MLVTAYFPHSSRYIRVQEGTDRFMYVLRLVWDSPTCLHIVTTERKIISDSEQQLPLIATSYDGYTAKKKKKK